jgi:hypothetical protein
MVCQPTPAARSVFGLVAGVVAAFSLMDVQHMFDASPDAYREDLAHTLQGG